ncbi:Ankyrin repeat domain-containing protein 50 [Termitomyces sp. T112]|nr:hypothetical protein C0989_005384 [Termitomyces sp. Mn162]KAG5734455.1 Ankyrin repeat domain-containing protein 50 [Termitomyces sp. T112]KAH0587904.1 hypothetical protein H2248_006656 [Termitomyces sp. 'cryptogamus']
MTRTEVQFADEIGKAISDGDLDRTALLLDEWSEVFSTPPDLDALLAFACKCGTVSSVCFLLSRGASVSKDAVIAACESNRLEILQAFLDSGWDINTNFGHIGDLLIMSVLSPSPVLKWALSHGADPNLNLIGESRTPLELSVSKDSMEHAEALIAAGAHINNTNALKIAACHGYTKMIELLLEKGADINEIPRPDYLDLNPEQGLGTALHEAAAEGQLVSVQLLLEKGADPTLQNTAGKTALELAQEQHHSEIVDVLEGRKCK